VLDRPGKEITMTDTQVKYDKIGVGYDTTRRPDPRIAERLYALLSPIPRGQYLDIACGTGNYTRCLHDLGVRMIGIDQSETMLEAARNKHRGITWRRADVTALPFPNSSFDGALCTQAIHHFPNLAAAFTEIRRVLRGGRLVIFGASRYQIRSYWLNEYFPRALKRAFDQQPSDDEIQAAVDKARLRLVEKEPWCVPTDPIDLFLYSGKHNPSIYLDEHVREGISTFASLADPDEVSRGLARLQADIDTGDISQVMVRYASKLGDYRFLVVERG
jgi:ubiquinone/menaquinone biosynthesis C-methylase UbiE